MNAATYALVFVYQVGPEPDEIGYDAFGTAFAVGDRLLATNAHITEGILGPTPFPIREVVAVQSGTGEVFKLLRGLTHPDYNKDPFGSPDIGLLTTDKVLPTKLPLASIEETGSLELGDELLLTGFPGDVDEFIPVIPGTTVPQATSLSGRVSALRGHKLDQIVTPETVDVVQHQAPTTPGTSGSALVHCGKVVAVNNAGTVQLVYTRGPDGNQVLTRQAAAANNFGAHVKFLTEMLSLFRDQAVQGFQIPPPFNPIEGLASSGPAGEERSAAPLATVPPAGPEQPPSPGCATLNTASSYTGTIQNLTASAQANVSISFMQSGCQVTGTMNIGPPLGGSGPLQGQIQGDKIGFTVPGVTNNAGVDIRFGGTISGQSIAGEYIIESIAQTGTWRVAASNMAAPGGVPAPVPSGAPGLTIDWGELERHFVIGNVRVGPQPVTSPTGMVQEFPVVAFTVQAKGTGLLVAGFQARFYDQNGIEVAPFSPLSFEPDHSAIGGWRPGVRSRGLFLLPSQETLARVRLIRVTGLF